MNIKIQGPIESEKHKKHTEINYLDSVALLYKKHGFSRSNSSLNRVSGQRMYYLNFKNNLVLLGYLTPFSLLPNLIGYNFFYSNPNETHIINKRYLLPYWMDQFGSLWKSYKPIIVKNNDFLTYRLVNF